MLSSLGAQAGYPVFGWVFFALTILGILSLSWYRHKNFFATVIEMLIILVSAISSMAISYLALNSAVSLEISIGLRLLVLVLITYCMWALGSFSIETSRSESLRPALDINVRAGLYFFPHIKHLSLMPCAWAAGHILISAGHKNQYIGYFCFVQIRQMGVLGWGLARVLKRRGLYVF